PRSAISPLSLLDALPICQPLGDGLLASTPTAHPDERSIVLPPSIPDGAEAMERYRLLAIEQGARVARGTRAFTPADPLERDLYQDRKSTRLNSSHDQISY